MAEQKKTVGLDAGIFVVRYAAAEEFFTHPRVKLAAAHPAMSFVSLDDPRRELTLWEPGSSAALIVREPSELQIEVVPLDEGTSTNATIKIDKLTLGNDNFHALGEHQPPRLGAGFDCAGLKVLGHIAGRGDVIVGPDQWLGGPTAPARIEGFAIEWPQRPRGLDIRYSAVLARPNIADSRPVPLGTFAGARGRAVPIVALGLELGGPLADELTMVGEALFLGSPLVRVTGKNLALAGPSRREALVGFRLRLERVNEAAADDATSEHEEDANSSDEAAAPSRVRVFRSKAKASPG